MLRGGIALHCVPGAYEYKVVMGLRQLKVQLWGGGGASGHLKGQQAGGGGGGAFVEALLNVIPGETLEIVVGAGGAKGQYGGTVQIVRDGVEINQTRPRPPRDTLDRVQTARDPELKHNLNFPHRCARTTPQNSRRRRCDLGVPSCGGAFTPSTRGWFLC